MTENVSHLSHRLSVAPMMDWTDRHCRYFHRRFSRRVLLYTEMVAVEALLRGPAERLLAFHPAERPLALQLGGSEPARLGAAAAMARQAGFDEVNLNVGCPSGRVQAGCFGAALMREPARVAECLAAMRASAGGLRVSLKCRIGVDEQVPQAVLPDFLAQVQAAGVCDVAVHARKAWLAGLSAKANRAVPPLDHGLVVAMKAAFPGLRIVINGGIDSIEAALGFLGQGLDGAMIGRAAYHAPAMLGAADRRVFGEAVEDVAPEDAVRAMLPYIAVELRRGTRLNRITRHMLGAFAGRPGARAWRRILSQGSHRPGAGPALVEHALAAVTASAEPVLT
ncbi:tRNA dihydrouridine(20/20a) synthase DusA [soil metagenome]